MLVNKLKDKDKNKGRKQDGPKTTTAKVRLAEAHKRKSGEEKGRKKKGTICAVVRPEDNEITPRARRADEPVPALEPAPPVSGAFAPPYSLNGVEQDGAPLWVTLRSSQSKTCVFSIVFPHLYMP